MLYIYIKDIKDIMEKLEKILAENMRRFKTKNLMEQIDWEKTPIPFEIRLGPRKVLLTNSYHDIGNAPDKSSVITEFNTSISKIFGAGTYAPGKSYEFDLEFKNIGDQPIERISIVQTENAFTTDIPYVKAKKRTMTRSGGTEIIPLVIVTPPDETNYMDYGFLIRWDDPYGGITTYLNPDEDNPQEFPQLDKDGYAITIMIAGA
jgi:hypothetical protein